MSLLHRFISKNNVKNVLYIDFLLDNISRYCKIEIVYIKLRVLCLNGAFYMSSYREQQNEDLKKIDALKKKYNLSNEQDVLNLYSQMQTGDISFLTDIGKAFDDSIFQKVEEIKSKKILETIVENSSPNTKKANKKKKGSKSTKTVIVLTKKEMIIRKTILVLLFLTSVFCLGYFSYYCYDAWKVDRESERLARLKENTVVNEMYADEEIEITNGEEKRTLKILDQYKSLYNSNKTLIGWLNIADTIIDYPVMQTGDNEYYLNHNIQLEEDRNGALFLDSHCDITNPGTNYIVYGHNMKSGKMFGSLDKYADKSFYEKHKEIRFDTIYEEGTYEVMYVFRSRVYQQDEIVFKYYQFYDANSEEEFQSYMKEMEALSLYDTGVKAQYGDHLLTLSTCDYEEKDGRFVVVAKRVK